MEKKKIMHVVVSLANGGTEKVIYNIIKYGDKKYEHYILVLGECNDHVKNKFININANVVENKLSFKNKNNLIRQLINIFNSYGVDVVHSHINYANAWVLMAAKKANINRRISHAHSMYSSSSSLFNKINRFIQLVLIEKNATCKIAVSDKVGKFFYHRNYVVINNGIDVNEYYVCHKKDTENIVIGNIGRYDQNKNQLFVIEIFNELYKKNKNYRLELYGPDGGFKQKCIDKINEFGLNEVARCNNAIDDVREAFKKIDLICFPSITEGFALSLLEAQLGNVQCISSDAVPNDVDLNLGLLMYLPLESGVQKWAEEIENIQKAKLNLTYNEINNAIKEKGFDIKDVVGKIETYY